MAEPLMRYPNADYQYAYDVCAMHAYAARSEIGIVASSRFHAFNLANRLPNAIVYPSAAWDQPTSYHDDLPIDRLASGDLPALRAVVWAQPLIQDAAVWMRRIAASLTHDGIICILTHGLLAERLTEVRRGWSISSGVALGWGGTLALLRGARLRIVGRYAFHGADSIAYSLAGALTSRFNRPDWADRWLYRMRAAFTWQAAHGVLAPLSALGVIVAAR
jgi:hypothetical protein